MNRFNVQNGVKKHFSSMCLTQKVLIVSGLLILMFQIPIDILRESYMWTGVMNEEQDKLDLYRKLIGHCECFLRDGSGKLQPCMRAYSSVWSAVSVLQFFCVATLILTKSQKFIGVLAGAYTAIIITLFVLFTDCGVLTEDDCYIVYLLLPNIIYAIVLVIHNFSQQKYVSNSCKPNYL